MKRSDLSVCHVEYYFGHKMHTHEAGPIDEAKWVYHNYDESQIKDNVLYKVWLTKSKPANDPSDLSSCTQVYYFEEVPEKILKMKEEVEAYWKSDEPMNLDSDDSN